MTEESCPYCAGSGEVFGKDGVGVPCPACDGSGKSPAPAMRDWRGMDGAAAWHLIDRHAEGWAEVGAMMEAWRLANERAS